MQYKVSYNAAQKTVYVQLEESELNPGYSVLGLFTNDEVNTGNSDVFYHQAQSFLNQNGITDMANIRVLTDVPSVTIAKPYRHGPVNGLYDRQGNFIGIQDRKGNLVPLGGIGQVRFANGLGIVNVGDQKFALLPVDANDDAYANFSHRHGNLADLLTVDGGIAEIGVASDQKSLVIYTGTPGEAWAFRKLDNDAGLGADSLAIGFNASTTANASKSLALGGYAKTEVIGQTDFGGAINGIHTSLVHMGMLTPDDELYQLTTDNQAVDVNNTVKLVRDGVFDVNVVVLARQIGTNNWARFERRGVVRKAGASTSIFNKTEPTPDVNNGLAGLTATLATVGGGVVYVGVTGLAATNIQWAGYMEIRALNIA